MNTENDKQAIYIEDFDYPLPDDRIAKHPLTKRDASKLLVYRKGEIEQSTFEHIADFIPEGSLLVYNNTRVIQARLQFQKETGAHIEVFCLEPLQPSDYVQSLSAESVCTWKCMVGNLKKWKNGSLKKQLKINNEELTLCATLIQSDGNTHSIEFSWNNPTHCFADILESGGELPIPPYLHRKTEENDKTAYQTVYSKIKGSVAAPTAGLHFTPEVFEQLSRKSIKTEELTLHVGAGTFQPVKTADIADHKMHTEFISVKLETLQQLQKNIGKIIAVGTTSVRTLESLYYLGLQINKNTPLPEKPFRVEQWSPYTDTALLSVEDSLQNIIDFLLRNKLHTIHAETQIIIQPGYTFKLIKGIITNFHQPKSTLLLLVSAFVKGEWKKIYNFALANNYRFLSFGDSSLLLND